MLDSTLNGRRGNPIGEAVWIVAGIVLLMAFGDVFVVLALVVAAVAMTAMWWAHRQAGRHEVHSDAQLAPVTQLHSRWMHHTSLHGPRAA